MSNLYALCKLYILFFQYFFYHSKWYFLKHSNCMKKSQLKKKVLTIQKEVGRMKALREEAEVHGFPYSLISMNVYLQSFFGGREVSLRDTHCCCGNGISEWQVCEGSSVREKVLGKRVGGLQRTIGGLEVEGQWNTWLDPQKGVQCFQPSGRPGLGALSRCSGSPLTTWPAEGGPELSLGGWWQCIASSRWCRIYCFNITCIGCYALIFTYNMYE